MTVYRAFSFNRVAVPGVLAAALCVLCVVQAKAAGPIGHVIDAVQPKIVKIYGAGGFRGMEDYQSGLLISPQGHILTVFSYVLDSDVITVTLHDGRKFEAKLLGADPRLEVAVLRIQGEDLHHFKLDQAVEAEAGTRILAFSNLFGIAMGNEPASVQRGTVSVKTQLEARRGVFETPYHGPVYVLDAVTNNPGAAGGALVDRRGQLVGLLGKELRNALNNTWLNYAVPISELRASVDQILSKGGIAAKPDKEGPQRPNRALDLAKLGLVLVPDVLERTPPFVDYVRAGSPAAAAGIKPDDLLLLLNDKLIQSCKSLQLDLEYIDHEDEIKLTVLRDQVQLVDFVLNSRTKNEPKKP
jgi:S1-C subfamily serine protease